MAKHTFIQARSNWLAPGAVMALIIGSGVSLWIQALHPGMATFLPAAAISHFTQETDVSPSAAARSVSADADVHRAADSVTELLAQTKPTLMRLQLSSTLGRMPLRMKTGTKLTLQARGFYSNTPTESKLVTATYSMNGTVIPECQSVNACTFKPAASGTYTLRVSKDGKTADAIIKVR